MDKKKTALLLQPVQIGKLTAPFSLLQITINKQIPNLETTELTLSGIKSAFKNLPLQPVNILEKLTVRYLESWKLSAKSGMLQTGLKEQLEQKLLAAYVQHVQISFFSLKPYYPYFSFYHQLPVAGASNRFKTAACRISSYTPGLSFKAGKSDTGHYFVESIIEINGKDFPLKDFNRFHFLLESKNEYFVLNTADYRTISWLDNVDWLVEAASLSDFSDNILKRLDEDYKVNRDELLEKIRIEVQPGGRVQLSEISNQFLMLTPQFDYDGKVAEGNFSPAFSIIEDGTEFIICRDKDAEEEIFTSIQSLHRNFSDQSNGYFYLTFDEAQKKNWFLKAFRKLLELNFQIAGMDMLKHFRYCPEEPETELRIIKQEADMIMLSFSLRFGKEEVPFADLQKVIRSGQQGIALKDGSIALLDENWIGQYGQLVKHASIDKKDIRLPKWLGIAFYNKTEGAWIKPVLSQDWLRRWQQWKQEDGVIYDKPASVTAELRPYQQRGYEWLRLMEEVGAGMFLADDMGLGKTLQTICLIASVLERYPDQKQLILCPTSLMYNWINELSKFAPSIKSAAYHGSGRSAAIFADDEVQILISTYGTFRADPEPFMKTTFSLIVLDESQAIKNPASQTAQLLHSMVGGRRLTLSGTPVMNNTYDLYSQFQFILPGMFISRQFFKREYADPIDRYKNQERATDLQKITAPFVLRRTKEQVASDLPDKTETILWCKMEPEQQQVYDEIRTQIKGEIFDAIKLQGMQKSKLQVLQGILKLRQVCNSPQLIKDMDSACTESVKMSTLLEEIENNLSNHKALVFSQFTSMLDILAEELTQKRIPFYLLTGATPARERDRLVKVFNDEADKVPVFLLSLKAGNAGLNLTAADYVFLFDPWWNTAVEQQAIDRTHRIGQTRNVFAYKLICKDSIEERILKLQERKHALAESLINEEDGFVKSLTEDDIKFLFQ